MILLEGGLKTPVAMLRLAFWPAAVLATVGVAFTAGVLGGIVSLANGVPLTAALLVGAAAAPTTPPRSRHCCDAPARRCRSVCLHFCRSILGSTIRCRYS